MGRTIQQRLQAALEKRGWVVDGAHRTTRYLAMKPTANTRFVQRMPDGNKLEVPFNATLAQQRYFLGRAGALRHSAVGNVGTSVVMERRKLRLLAEEV